MNFEQILKTHYTTLTKAEKKVADYILLAGEQIIYQTLTEVKEHTKVGDATIIRFCQKLGFSGFADLKIALAKEDFHQNQAKIPTTCFWDERANKIIHAITLTKEKLQKETLQQAIEVLQTAKRIFIFGVGSSGNISHDLEAMCLRVGLQAKAITDPHFQAQTAALMCKKDLVIAFSLSGKTKDTFESLQLAKENQATILAITNHLFSPIAQLADIVLQTAIDEFLDGGSLAGKVSQLYLCDLLLTGFETQNQQTIMQQREKVLRSILTKRFD